MAHAKLSDLADLAVLLAEMRGIPLLKEKSLGCFYYKSKGVLHFHVKDTRRYAHVFDGKDWQEIDIKPAPSVALQKKIQKEIYRLLPF
jgi:hypothetical protein